MAQVWTPIEFQKRLMEHGFALPKYGADGEWGEECARACDEWFAAGTDLAQPAGTAPTPKPPAEQGIVPASWMPVCRMDRVIVHWTAGAYRVTATDKEHYHVLVDGDGELFQGDHTIDDNVSTGDKDYAAHTLSCNQYSIGISAACMANAIEKPFDAGRYPLKQIQWETLAQVAADLCRKYGIKVTPQTVLQHGEVEKNLGIKQRGKWDILRLPWEPAMNSDKACNAFRAEVTARL